VRSVLVFFILLAVKVVARTLWRIDMQWLGDPGPKPWKGLRVVALLNHTSLYEPLFAGGPPNSFIWRIARHGVVPAAEKTTGRPIVGLLFKFVARNVIPITRERDSTWSEVLNTIDPDSMVVIAPEGRMKRPNGLDSKGQPMTVRGGIADILEVIPSGPMLLAYSGGLHHVQAPGEPMPRFFKTIRMRLERVDIESYRREMMEKYGPENFKRAVREDLERRRDLYAPVEPA
jgi:hypothetical protein